MEDCENFCCLLMHDHFELLFRGFLYLDIIILISVMSFSLIIIHMVRSSTLLCWQEFYHRHLNSTPVDLPRIFGMTASPINSKGSPSLSSLDFLYLGTLFSYPLEVDFEFWFCCHLHLLLSMNILLIVSLIFFFVIPSCRVRFWGCLQQADFWTWDAYGFKGQLE